VAVDVDVASGRNNLVVLLDSGERNVNALGEVASGELVNLSNIDDHRVLLGKISLIQT
jgi:hypothetical protein